MQFVLDIDPPRTTAQQQRIAGRRADGRPFIYDSKKLSAARNTLRTALLPHRPEEPLQGCVRIDVEWVFATPDKKKWGKWKTTRPDRSNLMKMFEDEMTRAGFWRDDAQLVSGNVDKYWDKEGRIVVCIEELEEKR